MLQAEVEEKASACLQHSLASAAPERFALRRLPWLPCQRANC